ncbi:hypothetical protein DL96DRAFT_1620574 [Flagelloscypha sp. PMI_526]|nr:hypothetical protein DL96DRAFT_1620574 [Flagelloscypha sp. PMI_526]
MEAMQSCQYQLNQDISGIGVRISFYLQTLFLSCLSARSESIDEIYGSLFTLLLTNTSMAVTGLILGLAPKPEIDYQDAIIVLYLLFLGWVAATASLASCKRLRKEMKILELASVIQSFAVMAFAFIVLGNADRFGKRPACNQTAVAFIFRPFSALKSGRIFGWVIVALIAGCYIVMTVWDYTARLINSRRVMKEPKTENPLPFVSPPTAGPLAATVSVKEELPRSSGNLERPATFYGTATVLKDDRLLFILLLVLVSWAFFVLNIELLIRRNHSSQNDPSSWQFGQILPMFLTLQTFSKMVLAFMEFGIKPVIRIEKEMTVIIPVVDPHGGQY